MKIAIIGFGFVGKALAAGLNASVNLLKIDPKLKTSVKDLKSFNPDVIFICVPTPMDNDGDQDISILKDVILQIIKLELNSLIVLKSTVLPSYIKEIKKLIPSFVYNPEFLREAHAIEDFIQSQLIVFGGPISSTKKLENIYKNFTKCECTEYIHTDPVAASFIKYTINSFLATKVSFFNEIHSLFKSSDSNETWANFIKALTRDQRIGSSHMQVPGHDKRYGFGGACLPKDSAALYNYSKDMGLPLRVLKKAISVNSKIRSQYKEITDREKEQNIKFKI